MKPEHFRMNKETCKKCRHVDIQQHDSHGGAGIMVRFYCKLHDFTVEYYGPRDFIGGGKEETHLCDDWEVTE